MVSNPTDLGDLPFQQIELAENKVIRTFDSDISEDELKWHWDEEDRLIKVLNKPDWLLQIDNAFPVALKENQLHYIREGVWHRLIKGTTNLIVEITKIKTYGRTSSNQSTE